MATKKKIGRYKILGELGRGAMGIVYKAEDPNLDRLVALKTIILEEDSDGRKEYQKRFMLEAKAAGKLHHPNIVTTFDCGEHEGMAYLAMELIEGTDLRARVQKESIPAAEAVEIARQAAEGLAFAHARGVVHRDIKPGNIMLNGGGQVKIMDFGLARMRMADYKTTTGMVLGTPRYMSPEQISGQPVDQRSDIFSLGIVLYEMLTGTRLFSGEDIHQVQHQITETEHVPPTRQVPGLPPMVDFVVARALKKDPAVRYQDAFELASDLRSALSELVDREAAAAGEKQRDRDTTKTMKLDAEALKAVLPMPTAAAIGSDTRLPVSVRFDCSDAIERLTAPTRADRALLRRAPRPVGLLRRLIRHRMLVATMIAAALVGGAIALA